MEKIILSYNVLARELHSLKQQFLLAIILFSLSGCIGKNTFEVNLKNPKKSTTESLNITVSNIQVVNHQVVITGTNLTNVSGFQIKEGSSNTNLQIESQTGTTIIANTMSNVTFAAGKFFDFIFSNAQAASTFTVNFSLCDSLLGGKGFDCTITPTDKQVLAYDAVTQKWKPKNVNGLDYRGSWDANSGDPAATTAGEYWIVSVAGGAYQVGDWLVFNGTTFDRIDNSQAILSVFGRTGNITADLNDLSDVVISAPANGQILQFNGTNWVNSANTYTETDPNVTAFAKTTLPTCGAGQVLKADGTSLSCVTDNTGAGAFSGTASRAVVTDGAGALTTSSITTTILNYLSNVTSDIQTQINAKLNSSSFIDWSTTGVQTIDPTRVNLTTANRVVVTNGSSNPSASSVTSTELGYLSGATSNIQTQLNSKLSSFTETDPNVTAFAKAALPTCNAGEVLKANGTSLSCVTDNAGAGAYTGTINRVVITNGTTGELTVSAVTNTELGYLSGVTSSIQTQLNAKQGALGTGSVTSTHILDGTITDADLAGSIAQSKITNLTTDLGNKQNTSTLASDVRGIALTGLSTATNAVISATDSILSAFGKLQKQITDLDGTTLKTTGGTLTVGTIDGVPNPSTANQVANKAYVDSAVSSPSVTCPTNYILVPANTTYFPKQFCVAKYEMKNDGYGTAVSQATGTPWVSIDRPTSRSKCQNLGSGYDMISNDQWQTIARNIASVSSNWDSGTVASGQLNRGHSDTLPASTLAAVTDDNNPCNGTGQTCSSSTWDSQRRTHTLSNGNKIWDFAGNVWEWVTNDSNVSNGADGYISTMSGGDIRQTRYGAASGTICASPSSSPFCGMGHGSFNYTAGAVLRGGNWSSGVSTGVFTSNLSDAPTSTNPNFGFRCVFVP